MDKKEFFFKICDESIYLSMSCLSNKPLEAIITLFHAEYLNHTYVN